MELRTSCATGASAMRRGGVAVVSPPPLRQGSLHRRKPTAKTYRNDLAVVSIHCEHVENAAVAEVDARAAAVGSTHIAAGLRQSGSHTSFFHQQLCAAATSSS